MKNRFLLFLLLSILLTSCSSVPTCENCDFHCIDENESDVITNSCIDNWECSFLVIPESKVDSDETWGYIKGNKNVFQIINSTLGSPNIADDEFTNILVFELDDSQNSFSVEDDQIKNINAYYKRTCYCSEVIFIKPDSGCIQGQKQIDGSWFVQANLSIPFSFGDIEYKMDAFFEN